MLIELRVENLLLIERAELRLEAGLNVITGETGAGKTVLAHALDLLLGGKPRAGIVRPGASEAYVEGIFSVPSGLLDGDEFADLRERLPEDEDEIVVGRRVSAEGRTRAFVQGRSATAADLQALGGRLLSFYGQHEHRKLTLSSAQLEILDAFCGPKHLAVRERYAERHNEVRGLERRLAELRGLIGARDRDRDLLTFELDEIDALDPSAEDEAALRAERARLREVDGLRAAAGAGAEALAPAGGDAAGAALALGEAERLAEAVAGADPALDALAERLRTLQIEADDLAAELRRYVEGLDADPARLEEVEARLDQYDRLLRKHGGTVEAVLAQAERCRAELARLDNSDVAIADAEAALEAARADERDLAGKLTTARKTAAPKLSKRVLSELRQLSMDHAAFEIALEPREGLGPAGAERVEFSIAPNPGVPAAPLRETASGGEMSRAMLALLTASGAAGGATLVFDEVDAGIGGQTARAVGERLRALADGRQVICITHLPQIASLARRHFRIAKSARGQVARTSVEALRDEQLVGELVRMLGGDTSDTGARRHAEELLAAA
jgi:DNA repair protein RecN (Recombination protein N)